MDKAKSEMRKDLRNRDSVSRGRDHLESRRRSRSPLRAHQCEVSTVSSREPHAYTEAPKLRDDESKNVLLCNLEGQPTGGICSTGSVIEVKLHFTHLPFRSGK